MAEEKNENGIHMTKGILGNTLLLTAQYQKGVQARETLDPPIFQIFWIIPDHSATKGVSLQCSQPCWVHFSHSEDRDHTQQTISKGPSSSSLQILSKWLCYEFKCQD